MIESIDRYLKRLIVIFVDRRTTKAFFQATVVLASAFLVGVREQAPFLFEQELSAYELKFDIEEKAGAPLGKIDCSALEQGVAECRLAQYKVENIESYTFAFMAVMDLIRFILILCGAGAIASFLLRPAFEEAELESS